MVYVHPLVSYSVMGHLPSCSKYVCKMNDALLWSFTFSVHQPGSFHRLHVGVFFELWAGSSPRYPTVLKNHTRTKFSIGTTKEYAFAHSLVIFCSLEW